MKRDRSECILSVTQCADPEEERETLCPCVGQFNPNCPSGILLPAGLTLLPTADLCVSFVFLISHSLLSVTVLLQVEPWQQSFYYFLSLLFSWPSPPAFSLSLVIVQKGNERRMNWISWTVSWSYTFTANQTWTHTKHTHWLMHKDGREKEKRSPVTWSRCAAVSFRSGHWWIQRSSGDLGAEAVRHWESLR